MQELIARGVLGPSFVDSYAHDDSALDQTLEAVRGALGVYSQAIDAGTTDGLLVGPPTKPAFRRRV
jgi:glutamate-1-semialdehyde 2,1-aminomutase